MNANTIHEVMNSAPKKDAITTTLKVLSAVYLVMNIIRLGKELTKKDKKARYKPY